MVVHVASQASASAAAAGVDKDFQDAIAGEAIVVFVRDLFNVSHVVEASMGTTGLGIMQMLYPIVELLPWQYVLIFAGRALGLEETLQAAGVMDGNTLFMKGKLAGGGKRGRTTESAEEGIHGLQTLADTLYGECVKSNNPNVQRLAQDTAAFAEQSKLNARVALKRKMRTVCGASLSKIVENMKQSNHKENRMSILASALMGAVYDNVASDSLLCAKGEQMAQVAVECWP